MFDLFGKSVKHPFLLILLIGIAIRAVLIPAAYSYDSDYLVIAVRNIEAGFGLYGAEGYYYTPVWGYVLSLISVLQDAFVDLGESAVRIVDALFVENYSESATIPSVAFLFSIEIVLYACDFVTAYVVSELVRDVTGDKRKSVTAFALVFLSPIVFLSSSIPLMPDIIGTMFAVLTVLLMKRRCMFLAGMTFSMAVLTKFFPSFLIFVFVAYILTATKDDSRPGINYFSQALAGACLVTVFLFLPQIAEGNLDRCFQFVTDRAVTNEGGSLFHMLIGYATVAFYTAILILSAYAGVRMYRESGSDSFRSMMRCSTLIVALALVFAINTQYIVLLIPFLAYRIATEDCNTKAWWLLAFGAVIVQSHSFTMLLLPISVWTGVFDTGTLLSLFSAWVNPVFLGISPDSIALVIGYFLQVLGILTVLWTEFGSRLIGKRTSHIVADGNTGG